MKRATILLGLLLALALTACGSRTGAGVPTTEAPANVAPSATTQPTEAQAATSAPETTPTVETTPQPTPDINKIINPQPDDWKLGPDGAKVTIIEWGDFQ